MADFFKGLTGGFQSGLQLGQQLRQRRMEDELAQAYAKPEEFVDYTPEQQRQIQGLQGAGGYDVQAVSGTEGQAPTLRYTAKPGSMYYDDMGQPEAPIEIAPQRVQRYGGQTVAGQFDPAQLRGLQMREAAGVLGRYGDVRGAAALEMQAEDFNNKAEERAYQARIRPLQEQQMVNQGLLTKGQIDEMNRNQVRTKKLEDVDTDVAAWFTKRTTDPETNEPRATTADDMLAQIQYRATALQKAGLAKEATASLKDYQDFAIKRIGLDDAERKSQIKGVAGAIGFGDFRPAVAFYDRFVLDGAKVKNIVEDPKTGAISVSRVRDDGTELPDKVLKGGRKELLAALNSFNNPTALYEFSQNEFNNNLKSRQVAVSETNARNASEMTGLNKQLVTARINNLNARTETEKAPPPLTEAQVTARARIMVTNREINPVTRKPYTSNEAVEFVKSGARDPVMDVLDNLLGGDTDPFAKK
jgi:hypothetical protein